MSESPAINPADHIRLAMWFAKKQYSRRDPVFDSDEFGDACLALCVAAKSYDPTRGEASFLTYATRAIVNTYGEKKLKQSAIKRTSGRKRAPLLLENLVAPEQPATVDNAEEVEKCLRHLSDRERRVLVARFLKGQSLKQVSKSERLHSSMITQIVTKAIRKIRNSYGITDRQD